MTNIHGPCALSLASLFASLFPIEFVRALTLFFGDVMRGVFNGIYDLCY